MSNVLIRLAMALGGALVILGILLCNRRVVSSRNDLPTTACKVP